MGILEALLNAEYPKTEIILNHKDYKRIMKKEITATIKGTDMFEFNGEWVNVAHIIKTSKDLTEENTKLLLQVDEMDYSLKSALEVGAEYLTELQQIKSTRLYKFFKWLGVW